MEGCGAIRKRYTTLFQTGRTTRVTGVMGSKDWTWSTADNSNGFWMEIKRWKGHRSNSNIALTMAFLKGHRCVVSRTKLSVLTDIGIPKTHRNYRKASGRIPPPRLGWWRKVERTRAGCPPLPPVCLLASRGLKPMQSFERNDAVYCWCYTKVSFNLSVLL